MTGKTEPFGAVAVKMGCCTTDDLQMALALQQALPRQGKPHKLIGMVLLENGLISCEDLIGILKYYRRHDH